LQETGFIWDLFYKGKLYEGIEFIPYVPFIACDTDEAQYTDFDDSHNVKVLQRGMYD